MWRFIHKHTTPKNFVKLAHIIQPWFAFIAVVLLGYGFIDGLYFAPADYQQGDAFRIIYIHVPSAFVSLMIYSMMTVWAIVYLVWRIKLADVFLTLSASLGAWFTALALATGAIWGKPMWGTWWIWDARLTSELILLFLYIGLIALRQALPAQTAARAVAMMTVVGFVDIPLIHYSVSWWNTLHQGPTISAFAKPSIANSMLWPLLAMIAGFICYFIATLLYRSKYEVLRREVHASWAKGYSI